MFKQTGLKTAILLFILLLSVTAGYTQVAYHNFTSNDGLPSNEVYCAIQDPKGFLWFGTDHGVVKYNGYKFTTYTTADGLTDNTVLSMKLDDDGNLWFLTLSGGMCYFDGNKFSPHPFNDTIKQLCNTKIPTSYEILPHKQVWLGLVDLGVARIDSNSAKLYTMVGDNMKSDSLRNFVWHFTDKRFVYYSFKNKVYLPQKPDLVKSIDDYSFKTDFRPLGGINFSMLFFKNNAVLISRASHLIYLDSMKIKNEYVWPSKNDISNLCQTSDGKMWVLLRNMPCYNIEYKDEKPLLSYSLDFIHNSSDIILDNQGNYWITTIDQGIYMIPNNNIRIYSHPSVSAISKFACINSNKDYLYVGASEGNLLKIDKHFTCTIQHIAQNPSAVSSISFNTDGSPVTNLDPIYGEHPDVMAYRTKVLPYGNHQYILGLTTGVDIIDKNKILYRSDLSGFNQKITEICQLNSHTYLVGTLKGLYYFETSNYHITEEPYFKGIRVTAAKTAPGGLTYCVTTRGKGAVIYTGGKFYAIGEDQGAISDLIEGLYFESDSVVWLASFKGISKVYFRHVADSLATRIENYTKEDGLCSNQVNNIIGFNGYIWLATNEGLCYFKPAHMAEDTIAIPLYIDNISVNGQNLSNDSLTLSHDQNNIYIEFNALYYKAIQGIRYKIRLKGVSSWKYTNLNYIQYYSLPPGEYQFEVAAEDIDGKYISDIHTLNFTIKPRFVDTVYFKILIGLLVLLIISIIISSIFSYQKLKTTNFIKLLQAEFKALSYQINPHFIFNVLNSIQYYILQKDTDNAVHLLGSFSLLIRRIVNNSRQQYIGIIEEVECLREYMDLEKMRLDNKFEYSINIDSSIDIEEKNILPMIIQPLVENSIWHGIVPSSKPGVISVDFKKENGAIVCKVEDNGVGINAKPEKKPKSQNNLSLAMKNVSERLKIISELNDSTWAIKTEDKSVNDPSQTGTIVIVVFPVVKSNT